MIKLLMNLFSIYISPFEKELDSFFTSISENSNKVQIKESLLSFMQRDMVSLCLYVERKFKGYKYLNKKNRRRYLSNVVKLNKFFDEFVLNTKISHDEMLNILKYLSIDIEKFNIDLERLIFLWKICLFFQKKVKYEYQESTSFGLLLEAPIEGKMVGDCNQIVSLYIYLYSRFFNINDIRLAIYKNHVCINYQGLDVEATVGTIRNVNKDIIKIVPIEEIVSINILDINDISKSSFVLSKHSVLESARLSYLLSSERDIVLSNLLNAYKNISIYYIKQSEYESSLSYALKSKDKDFYRKILVNIVELLTNKKLFQKADYFRRIYSNSNLDSFFFKNWGSYLFNKRKYDLAITKFQVINDVENIKLCYQGKYIELQNTIKNIKTIKEFNKNKSTIMKMRDYAKRSGNSSMINSIESLISLIN